MGIGIFFNHDDRLEDAVKNRDGQSYLSAMGKFWLENVNVDACRKETFILADELCYNATFLSYRATFSDRWFPKTNIYDSDNLSIARGFAERLRSQSQLCKAAEGFGYSDVSDFVQKYREMEDAMKAWAFREHRYFEAYYNAPLLCHFVATDELGAER